MKRFCKNTIALILMAVFAGCEDIVDGDGDININPNNPTTTGYENILITAQVGQIILQSGETARRGGIFAGTHTGIDRQHAGYTTYTVTTSDFDDLWDDAFINSYRNARLAQSIAEEEGVTGIAIGMAKVLQALALGTATALYGDIPFDELFNVDFENPNFEDQTVVYTKIQALLDDAIQDFSSGEDRPTSGTDFYFDGDPTAWTQVAHTLKARFYMHTREYANAYAAAQNGINSFEHSMYAPHSEALTASNLNWQFFANGTRGPDLVVSDFIVSILLPDASSNPEITNYRGNAKTNEASRYAFLFERNSIGFQPNVSEGGFAGQVTPAAIVTYQENLLILAESGVRSDGFNTGLDHLNSFRAFMDQGGYLIAPDMAGVSYEPYIAADFADGGIENTDGVPDNDALLREIVEERYITLFGQVEVFNDVRRTRNEPVVRVNVTPNTGNVLPERFIYPQSEIDRNSNTPDPIPNLFEPTMINQ